MASPHTPSLAGKSQPTGPSTKYSEQSRELFELCKRLPNARMTSSTHGRASCPVPDHGKGRGDQHPSFDFELTQNGEFLANCKCGCEFGDIVRVLKNNIRPTPTQTQRRKSSYYSSEPPSDVFRFVEDGKVVGIKERYDYPKDVGGKGDRAKRFVWFTTEGYQARTPGLNGRRVHRMPLYGRDKVAAAPTSRAVLFVEGERKVNMLEERGFLAVSAPGGAGQKEFGHSLNVLGGR